MDFIIILLVWLGFYLVFLELDKIKEKLKALDTNKD